MTNNILANKQEWEEYLKNRTSFFDYMKNEKKKSLQAAPQGTLHISKNKGYTQYYHRSEGNKRTGKFIKKKDLELAAHLAQKAYDESILKAIEQELDYLRLIRKNVPAILPEEIFFALSEQRQKLVRPVYPSDEDFIKEWESFQYTPKPFEKGDPEHYSSRNERVRSKSEAIIADTLRDMGIPYRYECPIYLKGYGIIHPDFTVLHVRKRKSMYLEHLGKMDEFSYNERTANRLSLYEKNGIFPGEQLVLTHETRKNPLNRKYLIMMFEHYFM